MYLTVTGKVTRSGSLFAINSPMWYVNENSVWSADIRNTGTTHFRSRYYVSLQNIFGNDVAPQLKGDALILPSTLRTVDGNIPKPPMPGIYRVVYDVGLGDSTAVREVRLIIYLPFWVMFLISIIIFLITIFVIRKRTLKN